MTVCGALSKNPWSLSSFVAFRFGRSGDSSLSAKREYFLRSSLRRAFWRAKRCPSTPPSSAAASSSACAPFGHRVALAPSSCDTRATLDHPRRFRHLSHDPTPTNSAVKPTIRAASSAPTVSAARGSSVWGWEVNGSGWEGGGAGGPGGGGGSGGATGAGRKGGVGGDGGDGGSGPSGVQPRSVARTSPVSFVSASVWSEYWVR